MVNFELQLAVPGALASLMAASVSKLHLVHSSMGSSFKVSSHHRGQREMANIHQRDHTALEIGVDAVKGKEGC